MRRVLFPADGLTIPLGLVVYMGETFPYFMVNEEMNAYSRARKGAMNDLMI